MVTLINSVLADNRVGDGVGGGLYSEGTVHLDNSMVRNNTVDGLGGGAGLMSVGTAVLINSLLADNRMAGSGGGLISRGE